MTWWDRCFWNISPRFRTGHMKFFRLFHDCPPLPSHWRCEAHFKEEKILLSLVSTRDWNYLLNEIRCIHLLWVTSCWLVASCCPDRRWLQLLTECIRWFGSREKKPVTPWRFLIFRRSVWMITICVTVNARPPHCGSLDVHLWPDGFLMQQYQSKTAIIRSKRPSGRKCKIMVIKQKWII